jgi:hypothetical protein
MDFRYSTSCAMTSYRSYHAGLTDLGRYGGRLSSRFYFSHTDNLGIESSPASPTTSYGRSQRARLFDRICPECLLFRVSGWDVIVRGPWEELWGRVRPGG